MASENGDLISIRDAARQCGKNAETVRRWVWSGKLPAEKLGNQLFIKKADLALFLRDLGAVSQAGAKSEGGGSGVSAEPDHTPKGARETTGQNDNDPGAHRISPEAEREDYLERVSTFRARLKARGAKPVDSGQLIREIREERMNELDQRLRGR